MILSVPQLQTTLSNGSTDAPIVDGGYFSPEELDPIDLAPPLDTMTPLESVFAQAVKRSHQEDSDARPSKRVRAPGRRIPCKARGISSVSHNTDTAFFDIPLDAPHGTLLCCSHPECAASGRRFRFCSVCEMPFAKRNFLKRHGHGLVHSSKELNEDDVENFLCQVIPSSSSPPSPPLPPLQTKPRRQHRRMVSFDQLDGSRKLVEEEPLKINDNEQQWLELLKERPKTVDQDQMTAWMGKIISFSEGSTKGIVLQQHCKAPAAAAAPVMVSPMATSSSMQSPNVVSWETSDVVDDSLISEPFETEQTEFAAFIDDFDFSSVFEDNNANHEAVEKVDSDIFCPIPL